MSGVAVSRASLWWRKSRSYLRFVLHSTPAAIERRVEREASLALTLGSAVLGAAGARLAIPDVPAVAWLLTPMLGLVGLLAASRCSGGRGDATVLWTALGGTCIAIPSAFCAASDPWVCGALFAAAPAGLVLYGTWLLLLGRLRELSAARTLEDGDLVGVHGGRWLTAVAAGGGWVALARLDGWLGAVSAVVATVGVVRWIAAEIRLQERRRWLDAVRRGHVAGWRLVPRRTVAPARAALLPIWSRATPCVEVLVETSSAGPYREGIGGVPRAIVPAVCAWPCPVPWRAPGPVARGSAALVGAVFAPFLGLALGVFAASVCAPGAPAASLEPGVVVGWTLLVSGPATGLLVGALASVAPPIRGTTLAVALASYCLGAPMLCVALAV